MDTRARSLVFGIVVAVSCCSPMRPEASLTLGSPEIIPIVVEQQQAPVNDTSIELLARVVCAECKGCPSSERLAIAHVALNRAARPTWWGDGLVDVLTKDSQFASWKSPLCREVLPERADGKPWSPGWIAKHRDIMAQIRFESLMAMEGERADPTGGAVYFHARRLGDIWDHLHEVSVPDEWRHRFYRDRG